MTIQNETKITQAMIDGAMRADNFNNESYKRKKLIFNSAGLITGMVLVSVTARSLAASGESPKLFIAVFGLVAIALLYYGMVGMDRTQLAQFRKKYADDIGKVFAYEISTEEIVVRLDNNNEMCQKSRKGLEVQKGAEQQKESEQQKVPEQQIESEQQKTPEQQIESEQQVIQWAEIAKCEQDLECIYMFTNDDCFILAKSGFVTFDAKEMMQLWGAIRASAEFQK